MLLDVGRTGRAERAIASREAVGHVHRAFCLSDLDLGYGAGFASLREPMLGVKIVRYLLLSARSPR